MIKSFVREPFERARFYRVGTELMGLEINLAMVGRWFIGAIEAMMIIGPAIVWLAGGWLAINGGGHGRDDRGVRRRTSARLYRPASALAGVQIQIVTNEQSWPPKKKF